MKKLSGNTLKNFLTGEHSEKELSEINTFIRESEENARQLFRLEELYHLGKSDTSLTEERIDRAEKKLAERIKREEAHRNRKPFARKWRRTTAAAVLILLAGGGSVYLLQSPKHHPDTIVEATAKDTVKEIALPDGTKVWLNSGATIKYAGKPDGKERHVHIDGEAYFEVAKDPRKPFVVQSDAMQVRVLGTTFNFKSGTCGVAETTLIEGEIEVRGNNNEGIIILAPGQRAELNKSAGRLTVKQVNAALDAVWRNNLIPFEQADLLTILKTLEQLYPVKFILSPDVSTNVTYTGALEKKTTIESVLDALKNTIPISYKTVDGNILISPE
ncbi:MAG: FecR domain-containing protein [Mediterranea sp.]|jgi:ferric-dicitrate binding protein FerR (iron transport regulator)|nr:FecR domain-containing protein [Mediterranea sp.]